MTSAREIEKLTVEIFVTILPGKFTNASGKANKVKSAHEFYTTAPGKLQRSARERLKYRWQFTIPKFLRDFKSFMGKKSATKSCGCLPLGV